MPDLQYTSPFCQVFSIPPTRSPPDVLEPARGAEKEGWRGTGCDRARENALKRGIQSITSNTVCPVTEVSQEDSDDRGHCLDLIPCKARREIGCLSTSLPSFRPYLDAAVTLVPNGSTCDS